jgi:hypothetical protein
VVLSADHEEANDVALSEPEYDKPDPVEVLPDKLDLTDDETDCRAGETDLLGPESEEEPDRDLEAEDKLDRDDEVKELEGGAVYVEMVELLV